MSFPNANRNTQFEMEGLESAPFPEPQVLKRNRSLSPERDEAEILPDILPGIQYRGVRDGSPWEVYCKIYQLKFDRFETVAARKEPPCKCVIMKCFSELDSREELRMIHSIRHDHIVTVLETFRFEGSLYVVFERMAISLVQIVASPPYPTEGELAAIVGQVDQADMKSRSMC
ncbi:hypothetical protein ABVK25_002951 [Lepraria finkii]|uniref:Protein kinase domain-containing protein n=1 Tax=Lepraria finkii TaxID=1340010 RepID=A0ABR4BFE7_9LECA